MAQQAVGFSGASMAAINRYIAQYKATHGGQPPPKYLIEAFIESQLSAGYGAAQAARTQALQEKSIKGNLKLGRESLALQQEKWEAEQEANKVMGYATLGMLGLKAAPAVYNLGKATGVWDWLGLGESDYSNMDYGFDYLEDFFDFGAGLAGGGIGSTEYLSDVAAFGEPW